MEIINVINSKVLKRKLPNGLTEVKEFCDQGLIWKHYFLNENNQLHGEYKWYWEDGRLEFHYLYINGIIIKDYKRRTLWS